MNRDQFGVYGVVVFAAALMLAGVWSARGQLAFQCGASILVLALSAALLRFAYIEGKR